MTITAKIVADSITTTGKRLVTMQLRYPRFIHAEAKTHRVIRIDDAEYEFLQEIGFMDEESLSRNASSSRAIPVERMIQDVLDDPAMPVAWGSNKPGMQAGEECVNAIIIPSKFGLTKNGFRYTREEAWLATRDRVVDMARGFAEAGYHKQIVNRLLEPFGHISVVVTATDWDNFFALRCHPDADPTMRALAEAMRDTMEASTSMMLLSHEWHTPYVSAEEAEALGPDNAVKASVARCARVSYLNHDGTNPDIEKDFALADRLIQSRHMSPFEHQAICAPSHGRSRNFSGGWIQNRELVEIN